MAKSKKSVYVCQNCGARRAKWEGRCSECGEWNSLVEEQAAPERRGWIPQAGAGASSSATKVDIFNLMDSPSLDSGERTATGLSEVDRVLGGGLVHGSYILLGGDPGIGKSTLVMQIAGHLAAAGSRVLYVSAEESVQQTALRARRLGVKSGDLELASESSLDAVIAAAVDRKPALLIVDSIQTVFTSDVESAPGSVSQVRECAGRLLQLAKTSGISVILIGHVTKDGSLAGPRVLEHMVDTVLAFEGDHHQQFRLLRAIKNRFGATNEIGVFQMAGSGLMEVSNPSEFFLEERRDNRVGSAVFAAMEGSRPLLCEVQALSTSTQLMSPRRTALGIDTNRVQMLAAVLDKHTALSMQRDLYVNVVGGLRLEEPAADLAVAAALASSELQVQLPAMSCFFGEIGLTGEIRGANWVEERLKEAVKLGFKRVYLPVSNKRSVDAAAWAKKIELVWLSDVRDFVDRLGPGVPKRSGGRSASAVAAKASKPTPNSDLDF